MQAQQFSAKPKIVLGLYPALGKADAWNQGGDAPLSPPSIPHPVWVFFYENS